MTHKIEGSPMPVARQQQKLTLKEQRLKDACVEFESIMTNYLLKSMRQSIDRSEKPEQAREVYEGLFDEAVSKNIAQSQGNGLSDLLFKQLSPLLNEKGGKSSGNNAAK